MHKFARHLRPLIVAALLAAPAGSQANIGIGLGEGIPDLGAVGAGHGAPATFILLEAGGHITLNAGGSVRCNAC